MSIGKIRWYSTIRTKIIMVVIISCTIVLGGLSVFNTINEQKSLSSDLTKLAKVTSTRLSKHLIGPMWDLDSNLVDATIEADWLEGKLAEQVNGTAKMTLACALGYKLPAFESRLNVAEGKAAATARQTDQKRQLSPGEKSKAEKKKEQKKQKRAAAKARKAALTAKPGPGAVTAVKPGNGAPLKRMVGGNPAGPPCRNFESGKCTGPCRFSHNQDGDDDLAQIDDEEDPADDE